MNMRARSTKKNPQVVFIGKSVALNSADVLKRVFQVDGWQLSETSLLDAEICATKDVLVVYAYGIVYKEILEIVANSGGKLPFCIYIYHYNDHPNDTSLPNLPEGNITCILLGSKSIYEILNIANNALVEKNN